MRRREFIGLIGGTAILPLTTSAQPQSRVRRIGALMGTTSRASFESALGELGWISGQNLEIHYRWGAGVADLTRASRKELIELKPDVIFAVTNAAMAALHAQASTIPTVFAMVSDPVAMHYVQSLAKPGGNVTGFTPFEPSLGGKWVSLLNEIAPKVEHIGLIFDPGPGNNMALFRASIDAAAPALGIKSIESPANDVADVERLIFSLGQAQNTGLIFLPDAYTATHREELVTLVARHRVPAVYPLRAFCTAGGLMSYGIDIDQLVRQAASYVDRVLRGAAPGELPVQAPTRFGWS
jgi:putative tryptophan/tyrosine transport system substrate-binding protein